MRREPGDVLVTGCSRGPTVIDDEDGLSTLRCSSVTDAHGFLARLGATFLPHIRRDVVDLRPAFAA